MQIQESDKQKSSDLTLNEAKQLAIYSYPYQKRSVKITMIAIFAALAIGASYMLAPFINIELMSVLLFISGFLYGWYIGLFVGIISSLVYYGWNPFGVPPLPIYMVCVGCMAFIGLFGGIIKSNSHIKKIEINTRNISKLALVGFFYTVLFDLLTNLVYAYVYYAGDFRLALITGFPFMIIHLISNTVVFSVLVLPINNTVETLQS